MSKTVFEVTLDEKANAKLEKIKADYELKTDRGAFIVVISLACELGSHIDKEGCISLLDGTRIKVRKILSGKLG